MTEAIVIVVIVNSFAIAGIGLKAYWSYKAKKSGNNPHPCAAHGKWIKEIDDKLEEQGKQIARIEGILNGTYRK